MKQHELLAPEKIRAEFPILNRKIFEKDLIYLDSAATSIKPRTVIDRITEYYSFETANVHRGAHYLANLGTQHYEESRVKIQHFLNAKDSSEIIFVRGTTEGINLVASSFGESFLQEGDKIVLTIMEHHSNIVPWQMLALKKNLKIEFAEINEVGDLDHVDFMEKIKGAKLVAVSACSNTLGTVNDIHKICQLAHDNGAKILIDGAQIVCHEQIDVQKIDCDFFVFSGHKIFAPTGVGVLYAKKHLLESMPPYQGGGSMISEVTTTGTTFNDIPYKFEAGTPHVAGVIGLSTAIDFVSQVSYQQIKKHELELLKILTDQLTAIPGLQIYGTSQNKVGIVSFNIKGCHHSDLGQLLDQQGIAVRVGHHCTQPLLARLKVTGTVRASLGIHNNLNDINTFITAVSKARELLL